MNNQSAPNGQYATTAAPGLTPAAEHVVRRVPCTLTFEQRKKTLIAEAAACRHEIGVSRNIIRANLQLERLAKNTVSHLTTAAYSAVDNVFNMNAIRGGSLGKLLPVAASVYSIVSRRRLIVPILRGAGVVVGVVAALIYFSRRKKAQKRAMRNDHVG